MGWTTDAPSVKTWEQEQTTFWEQNNFNLKSTQSIGRMSGKGYAVKIVIVATYTSTTFGNSIPLYLSCAGNSTTAYSLNTKNTTLTIYYEGEAAAGASIVTFVGWTESSGSQKTLTFTAPKLLGATVYVNVGGNWKQGTSFAKVNGEWKDGLTKMKVDGEWK